MCPGRQGAQVVGAPTGPPRRPQARSLVAGGHSRVPGTGPGRWLAAVAQSPAACWTRSSHSRLPWLAWSVCSGLHSGPLPIQRHNSGICWSVPASGHHVDLYCRWQGLVAFRTACVSRALHSIHSPDEVAREASFQGQPSPSPAASLVPPAGSPATRTPSAAEVAMFSP